MRRYDFIVLGSGIAGLSFALKVAPHGSVAIVTKKSRAESNTNYAQGGIAAVLDPADTPEEHLADTLVDARLQINGGTARLGRLLAPMGIRYIVVPKQLSTAGDTPEQLDVPAALTRALGSQLDEAIEGGACLLLGELYSTHGGEARGQLDPRLRGLERRAASLEAIDGVLARVADEVHGDAAVAALGAATAKAKTGASSAAIAKADRSAAVFPPNTKSASQPVAMINVRDW